MSKELVVYLLLQIRNQQEAVAQCLIGAGILCLILSAIIGVYRWYFNLKRGFIPWFRLMPVLIWLIANIATVWGAYATAKGISILANDSIDTYQTSVLLVLTRWFVSVTIGAIMAHGVMGYIAPYQTESESDILAEGERMKQEYIRSRKELQSPLKAAGESGGRQHPAAY